MVRQYKPNELRCIFCQVVLQDVINYNKKASNN